MAERRMIAKAVIETDSFVDMPLSAQALYFHFILQADDDGFITRPVAIRREVGASEADCMELISRGYIIQFTSGVVLIVHWNIQNRVRADRRKASTCKERALVCLNDSDEWQLVDGCPSDGCQTVVSWLPDGGQVTDRRQTDSGQEKQATTKLKARAASNGAGFGAGCHVVDNGRSDGGELSAQYSKGQVSTGQGSIGEVRGDGSQPPASSPALPASSLSSLFAEVAPGRLREALQAYEQMRTKKGKPLTQYSSQLMLKDLEEYSQGDTEKKIAILSRSTARNWTSIRPLEDAGARGSGDTEEARLAREREAVLARLNADNRGCMA